MHSVQLTENAHLTFPGNLAMTNHSCQPNGKLLFVGSFMGKTKRWQLSGINFTALRFIPRGEPIAFDYNTTEWELSSPFPCDCNQSNCLGSIRGFKHLSEADRGVRQHLISPYISQKWSSLEDEFHFDVQVMSTWDRYISWDHAVGERPRWFRKPTQSPGRVQVARFQNEKAFCTNATVLMTM